MQTLVRPRGVVLGLLAALGLLATACATTSPTPPPPRAQGTPDRSPVTAGVIVIVTDQTGTLLGAVSLPNPVANPITIKQEDLVKPEDIEKVLAEKTFLAPGIQTLTIFGMGDPCQYVIQGGRAIKRCW
jgi:hypothetical protein